MEERKIELTDEDIISGKYRIDLFEDGDFDIDYAKVESEDENGIYCVSFVGKYLEYGKNFNKDWRPAEMTVTFVNVPIPKDSTIMELCSSEWDTYEIERKE